MAIKEGWGFQLAFPNQTETLIWDGLHMNRVESSVSRDCVSISVAPLQSRTRLSWVAGMAMSGKRNAELLLALSRSCCTCPLPLTVDGRRLDSLQYAEYHGWSKTTYPITLDFADAALPEIPLPPGTFKEITVPLDGNSFLDDTRDGGGWRAIAEKRWRNLPPRESAALPFILCLNLERVREGKSYRWEEKLGPSTVYWVLDGVMIATEPLLKEYYYCSVGCFLSAQDLQTDLSTFQLLESTERRQRLSTAREALLPAVSSVDDNDFEEMARRAKLWHRVGGGTTATVGVLLLWSIPLCGIAALMIGGSVFFMAGAEQERKVQSARSSRKVLIAGLRSVRLRH